MSLSVALRRTINVQNVISACQKMPQNDYNLLHPQLQQQQQQARGMSRVKDRFTVQPFWHAKVNRTLYPEHITPENEEFLDKVVEERYLSKESPLQVEPWPRGEWTSKSQRCGLVGKKIGMYPMWKKNGARVTTTIIQIADNHVISYVSAEELLKNEHRNVVRYSKNPRGCLVVGADSADPRMFTREYFNMFEKCGVMPKKKLTKFIVSDNAILQPGTPLYATHFRPGDCLDISGYTIDRGIQGVIKRWGFKGGPATHGCTKFHRKPGYIGCGGKRHTVLPGHKMAGHMGMQHVTLRGVKILRINSKFNCLWVNGPIPGDVGTYLNLYDSGLHHNRHRDPDSHPPFPTHYPAEQQLEHVDWYDDTIHQFIDDTIKFDEVQQ